MNLIDVGRKVTLRDGNLQYEIIDRTGDRPGSPSDVVVYYLKLISRPTFWGRADNFITVTDRTFWSIFDPSKK